MSDNWMIDDGIRDEGAKALSEMLRVNRSLTSLDLARKEDGTGEKTKEISNC